MATALSAALLVSGSGAGAAQADSLEITAGAPPKTFVEGVDFREMAFAQSGDVTSHVTAVDLTIPPGSTLSDSGCEASDFIGFAPGSIALIQRGTCYFREKARNAAAAGATAMIVFNSPRAGGTDVFGGTAAAEDGVTPAPLPIVATSTAVGIELANAVTNGPTGIVARVAMDGVAPNVPPELHLPADVTVDATDPSGALVDYTVTATDEDGATAPTIECTPLSGSTFPVGETTVACMATDAQGGADNGSFLVRVLGAAEQADELIDQIEESDLPHGTRRSLTSKLEAARDAADRGNTNAACNSIGAFEHHVNAQRRRIGDAEATALLEEAEAIAAALGC